MVRHDTDRMAREARGRLMAMKDLLTMTRGRPLSVMPIRAVVCIEWALISGRSSFRVPIGRASAPRRTHDRTERTSESGVVGNDGTVEMKDIDLATRSGPIGQAKPRDCGPWWTASQSVAVPVLLNGRGASGGARA